MQNQACLIMENPNKTTEQLVMEIIADTLPLVQRDKIVPSAKLVEDLGMDGMDLISIVHGLEGEFKLDIPEVDSKGWITVEDVINYVKTSQTKESEG